MQIVLVLFAEVLRCLFLRFLPLPQYNGGELNLVCSHAASMATNFRKTLGMAVSDYFEPD